MGRGKKSSLGRKLFISYLLAGIIPAIIVAATSYRRTVMEQQNIIDHSLDAYRNSVDNIALLEKNNLLLLTKLISDDTRARDAVLAGNASSLQGQLDHSLTQANRADYLFVVDEGGKVLVESLSPLARQQGVNPEKFRTKTLGKESVSLRSNDRGDGIDIRASSPIRDASGKVLGTVLSGATISTDSFVDSIKNSFNIEFTIFRDDVRVATSLSNNGSRPTGTKLTDEEIKRAVIEGGETRHGRTSLFGRRYFTSYWPIHNEEGRCIGMFFMGVPTASVDRSNLVLFEIIITILLITAGLLILVAYCMTKNITKPINAAVNMLVDSSAEVASAADHIAGSCQRLAGASNTQAHEMSTSNAALEELTGFAKENAENTKAAVKQMAETRTSAHEADTLMRELMQSMETIQDSSNRVSGVIKSIEDISFQTNLLALNAAVEAARAGEHGKGFAVVADEVRNLAQRAAEAARSTTSIIGESVEHTRAGVEKADISARSIESILKGTQQVDAMLASIGTASSEQSTGIANLSHAVSTMDGVNREVVENSNEAAHSAEELAAQSKRLDEVIGDLSALIGASPVAVRKPKVKRKKASGKETSGVRRGQRLLGFTKAS